MAQYKKIQIGFAYEAVSETIIVRSQENENSIPQKYFKSERQALDGTTYQQYTTTNKKRTITYKYDKASEDVFNFFNNAFESSLLGNEITFTRDGESYICVFTNWQYKEFTFENSIITNAYNLEITVIEV